LRRLLSSARRCFPAAKYRIHSGLDLVLCKFGKSFDSLAITPSIDHEVLTFNKSKPLNLGEECQVLWRIRRRLMQAGDPINPTRFLGAAGQWPCHGRTTK